MNKKTLELYIESNPFEQLNKIVFYMLLKEISSLKYKPGQKLNVSQISSDLQISRTPITEALKMLVEYGLVEDNLDKQGYYVSVLSRKEAIDIHKARKALESMAAFICAENGSCPNIDKMEELAYRFVDFFKKEKYEIVDAVDVPFHKLIIESSGNKYIQRCYKLLERQLYRYQCYSMSNVKNDNINPISNELEYQHISIVNAIKLHLPNLARQSMEQHIDSCMMLLNGYMRN